MLRPAALALTAASLALAPSSNGQSHFRALQPSLDRAAAPVLADFDGDGDLDLLLVGGPPALLLNDGLGQFRDDGTRRVPDERILDAAAVADLDGDGDLDFAGVTNDVNGLDVTRITLMINDGTGRFTALPNALPTFQAYAYALAFEDVDADGDQDLFVGRTFLKDLSNAADDLLFVNDGQGGFSDASQRLPVWLESTRWACFDDLDADGDADLVTTSTDLQVIVNGQFTVIPGTTRAHLNDGTGHFALGMAIGDQASKVGTFDADGDGDRDLITVSEMGGGARIQLNDGSGRFTQSSEEFPRHPQLPIQPADFVHDLVVDDVDDDGDLDVVLAWQFQRFPDLSQESDRLHLNDGAGHFTLVPDWRDLPGSFPQLGASTRLACGDVDGDGDTDLIGNARGVRFYRNVQRQVTMPFQFPLGSTQQIALRSEPSRATRPHAAFVGLSPRSTPLPIPGLGTLWLLPGSILEIGIATVPAPSGQIDLPISVPADPALEGIRFRVQALWTGDGIEPARLSNAANGQVVR